VWCACYAVTAGNYSVTVLAAETYFTTTRARNFTCQIQGVPVSPWIDLVDLVGFRAAANFSALVSATSTITISFRNFVDNAVYVYRLCLVSSCLHF
jgi:hypothetical protein